ncbi:MAG TPA: STAS domain-containing protein [Terriglobia bacterium]|jgi:anti-sigma B factor antagonist|nr:STAS domain-containing protein [Terriglobia bacterium]
MSLHIVDKLMDDVLVLEARGRIMLGPETEVLRRRIKSAAESGHTRIVLDLAGVDYIDSAGLGTLVGGAASVRKAGGELKLANLTSRVRDLIQITRLSTLFEVHDSLDKARASFVIPESN